MTTDNPGFTIAHFYFVSKQFVPKESDSSQKSDSNSETTKLKIDDKDIQFFRKSLKTDCDFLQTKSNYKDEKLVTWYLTFFKGCDYERTIAIIFTPKKMSKDDLKQFKNYWLVQFKGYPFFTAVYSSKEATQELIESISFTLRGSKTIKAENYIAHSRYKTHLDAKDFAFIMDDSNTNKYSQYPQFERMLLLQALAYSYLDIIQKHSDNLAEITKRHNTSELEDIYISVSHFNAQSYFSYPIDYKAIVLAEFWEEIKQKLHLGKNNDELLKQLQSIHHILNLKTERQQQEQEYRMNIKLAILAIIISVFGLIELFQ